jgi:hypothetical protein
MAQVGTWVWGQNSKTELVGLVMDALVETALWEEAGGLVCMRQHWL